MQQNRFIYQENLGMLYNTIEKTGAQWSVKAGLRIEQTWSHGNAVTMNQQFSRSYAGWFPSLFLMRTFNEQKASALYFNYARKITRPSLSDLNPNRLQFNNYTAVTGDPDVTPQYTHNIELGYNFLHSCSVSTYASFTTDAISLLADTGKNNFIEYYTVNFRQSIDYGIAINLPVKITAWWTSNNSLSFYNVSYSNQQLISRRNSFAIKSVHTAPIKNWFDLDLVADYRSATASSNLTMPSQFYLDLGLTKKLFNDQLRLRLSATDLFNTLREKEITDNNNVYIDFYRKRPTRTFACTITWNFSKGKKFTNKKPEQTSKEEKARIGN